MYNIPRGLPLNPPIMIKMLKDGKEVHMTHMRGVDSRFNGPDEVIKLAVDVINSRKDEVPEWDELKIHHGLFTLRYNKTDTNLKAA